MPKLKGKKKLGGIDLCEISRNCRVMGSNLGDLPSYDPHNFSQLKLSDPSNPSVRTLTLCIFLLQKYPSFCLYKFFVIV